MLTSFKLEIQQFLLNTISYSLRAVNNGRKKEAHLFELSLVINGNLRPTLTFIHQGARISDVVNSCKKLRHKLIG